MLLAVKDKAVTKAKRDAIAYKKQADEVLLSRGKSTEGKIFKSGSSEDDIFSILKSL